jgi:hypothetical protein
LITAATNQPTSNGRNQTGIGRRSGILGRFQRCGLAKCQAKRFPSAVQSTNSTVPMTTPRGGVLTAKPWRLASINSTAAANLPQLA